LIDFPYYTHVPPFYTVCSSFLWILNWTTMVDYSDQLASLDNLTLAFLCHVIAPTNRRQGAPLWETGGLHEKRDTSPRDTSRKAQDLAILRLPEGLAELPSTRDISGEAVKMPLWASHAVATPLEGDVSHDVRERGAKVQVWLHKASFPLPPFQKVWGGRCKYNMGCLHRQPLLVSQESWCGHEPCPWLG
jgi:hypothetical protein